MNWTGRLPGVGGVAKVELTQGKTLFQLWERCLFGPIQSAVGNGGKQFRSQIVRFAFDVAAAEQEVDEQRRSALCDRAADLVEMLHFGSMIIDDIEDRSEYRRGRPTLYREVGTGVALNSGNWLYFYPLEKIPDWGLDTETKAKVYELCIQALSRAHYGQALDVGVAVDELPQDQVADTCMATLELKTGALMGLAAELGAVLGGADSQTFELLRRLGVAFGVALQMFDDVGNLEPGGSGGDAKRYEDLALKRPGWIWAVAARECDPQTFAAFKQAVRALPDNALIEEWFERTALKVRAKTGAIEFLDQAFAPLEDRLGASEVEHWVEQISQKLRGAYA